ncbi:MAG: hypothetical protein GY718_01920 [Lentisphaerae bacterium]|nr:hypothetical protein [Lentisphaerota bacterium]
MDDFQTVRIFTHVKGFKDDVEYIEYHETGRIVFVLKDGDRVFGGYGDVKGFERMVECGLWKELKAYRIWPSTEAHIFKDCY